MITKLKENLWLSRLAIIWMTTKLKENLWLSRLPIIWDGWFHDASGWDLPRCDVKTKSASSRLPRCHKKIAGHNRTTADHAKLSEANLTHLIQHQREGQRTRAIAPQSCWWLPSCIIAMVAKHMLFLWWIWERTMVAAQQQLVNEDTYPSGSTKCSTKMSNIAASSWYTRAVFLGQSLSSSPIWIEFGPALELFPVLKAVDHILQFLTEPPTPDKGCLL